MLNSDGFFFSVSGTCFRNIGKQVLFPYFLFLFPIFVRNSTPPYFLPFCLNRDYKKKSPAKKKTIVRDSTALQGPQGDGRWQCAVCAWGSSVCWATPSAGATSGAPPAVVRHTDGPRSFCRCIVCRWWSPKFCRGLDVSGGRIQWTEDKVCVCVCACVCVIIYFKCVRLVI
jgi:hypothetical protein